MSYAFATHRDLDSRDIVSAQVSERSERELVRDDIDGVRQAS